MSIFYLSCNDNAVIEIQHTQKKSDLQTHLVEFLADIFPHECSRIFTLWADRWLNLADHKTDTYNIYMILMNNLVTAAKFRRYCIYNSQINNCCLVKKVVSI
jgi:hypothetical protein